MGSAFHLAMQSALVAGWTLYVLALLVRRNG